MEALPTISSSHPQRSFPETTLFDAQNLLRGNLAAPFNEEVHGVDQSFATNGPFNHGYGEAYGVPDFESMDVDEWSKTYLDSDGMGNDQFAGFDSTHGLDTGQHQVPAATPQPADRPLDPIANFFGNFSGGGEPSGPLPLSQYTTAFAAVSEPKLFDPDTDQPEDHPSFAHSAQHDEGDSEGESISDNDETGPSPRRPQGQGACKDPTRQCEHSPECSRPARRIPGRFGGRQFCSRHGTQWENKNCGPPVWQPLVVPTDRAVAMIRPNIVPPPEYIHSGAHDQSLEGHRDGLAMWTGQFHQAAMRPYQGEGRECADPYGLLAHQGTFERKAKSRRHQEYREEMIGARISLLFPIAWRYHQGGPAIYGTGGDNSGYRTDNQLSFLERLQLIKSVLKSNKRVVMDVIEGRGVEAFVRGPRDFDKRKRTNKKGNVARQERNAVAEDDTGTESRQLSVGIGESEVAAQAEHDTFFPSADTKKPQAAAATTRKRKRQLKEDAGDPSDRATSAPIQTIASRGASVVPEDLPLASGSGEPKQLLPEPHMTTPSGPNMALDCDWFPQPMTNSDFRRPANQLLASAPASTGQGLAAHSSRGTSMEANNRPPQMASARHQYSSALPGRPVGEFSFPQPQLQQTPAAQHQVYHSLPQTPQMLHLSQHTVPWPPGQLRPDHHSAMQSRLAASRSVLGRHAAGGRFPAPGDAENSLTPVLLTPSEHRAPTRAVVQSSAGEFGQPESPHEAALHVADMPVGRNLSG